MYWRGEQQHRSRSHIHASPKAASHVPNSSRFGIVCPQTAPIGVAGARADRVEIVDLIQTDDELFDKVCHTVWPFGLRLRGQCYQAGAHVEQTAVL